MYFSAVARSLESGVLIDEAVALVLRILVALELLRLNTHVGQLVLAFHHEDGKLLAHVRVGVVVECILCRDDACLVVVAATGAVAEIGSEIVVEFGGQIGLEDQLILQFKHPLLCRRFQLSVGKEVEVVLEGSDGSHGRCLVQSCLGSALVEALANIEGSGLRIDPPAGRSGSTS